MEYTIGNQRFTTVGNILPTGTALRVTSVHAYSSISASSLTLHNGLVSSTTATIYLVFKTDSQGTIHEYGMDAYFPDGVWLDTFAAGTITTVIGFGTVQA